MTLTELQELVDAWAVKNDVSIDTRILAGELARDAGALGDVVCGGRNEDIAKRIGDLLWSVTRIANRTELDLTSIIAETLARKEK